MIVKVQLHLETNIIPTPKRLVLIYNQRRTIFFEDEASEEIISIMDGSPKKYFESKTELDGFGRIKGVKLIKEIEAQEW